jgi:hypothetical protein
MPSHPFRVRVHAAAAAECGFTGTPGVLRRHARRSGAGRRRLRAARVGPQSLRAEVRRVARDGKRVAATVRKLAQDVAAVSEQVGAVHAVLRRLDPAPPATAAAVATYGGDQALADARVQARAERFAPPPPQAAAASRELCERLAAVEVRQGEMRSMLVGLARVGAPGTPSSSSVSASSSTSSSSSSSS